MAETSRSAMSRIARVWKDTGTPSPIMLEMSPHECSIPGCRYNAGAAIETGAGMELLCARHYLAVRKLVERTA